MTIEHETMVERPLEQETVVTTGTDPFVIVAGIIVAILLASLLLWYIGGAGEHGSVTVDLPEVTIRE
ncbi:hypothetical protein [Pelagibacterium limicola]|uniref:hypothetical protein n=1 Tax=Pelagibacterium limicola TaxID=2791022 RepID=UPI0018AF74C6|nr:hypothetical protein [Pelagibacterium limicola]